MTNEQLELAYNYVQYTHRNVFLTGKAGTGKTTFLRQLQSQSAKRMVVVAPTGVAAINAGGVTIHSFFQLAPGLYLPNLQQEKKSYYQFSKHKLNILRSLDLLVIDEVSMVRCDLLDAIDGVLRRFQNRDLPFGGVQLLLIGDLQQLAPVADPNEWMLLQQAGYKTQYFFGSKALQMTDYATIELTKVFRQTDATFVKLLNAVRDSRLDDTTMKMLNSRFIPGFRPPIDKDYITLTTHNAQAQDINQMQMTMLPTKPMTYQAKVKGDFPETVYPTDAQLTLKVGAQVMFCKNDPMHKYYNGKIGKVVKCDADRVLVVCKPDSHNEPGMEDENDVIEVTVQTWDNTKYVSDPATGAIKEEVTGSFSQIPLKTAWAITIHKSQGLTFDNCIINAGRAFSPGQVYVALSRCRTLEGLVLSTPIVREVITVDQTVMSYNQYVAQNQPTAEMLRQDRRNYMELILMQVFSFYNLQRSLNYVIRLMEEHAVREFPIRVSRAREMSAAVMQSLTQVGTNFCNQIHSLVPLADDYDHNPQLQERVSKAVVYFLEKSADLMQEFIDQGCPPIANKTFFEQMDKEFDVLKAEYMTKMQCFTRFIKNGFSLDEYWNAKAVANMSMDENEPKKPRRTKKQIAEESEEDSMFAKDDVAIDPEAERKQMRAKAIRQMYAIAKAKSKGKGKK